MKHALQASTSYTVVPIHISTVYTTITYHRRKFGHIIEGSLDAKLPTIWTDGQAQPGRHSDAEKVRREKIRVEEDQSEMEKVRREKMQVRENVGKSRGTVFFRCFVAPEVGSLKRRVRSQLAR